MYYLFQRDFDVRELREFNKRAIKEMGEVVHHHPEVGQAVHLYFTQVRQCFTHFKYV